MSKEETDQLLEAFLAELDVGLATYGKGDAKKRRTGALQQFNAVIEWATRTPGVAERLMLLRHLFKAVAGIDTGYRDKLLAPPSVGHRSRLSVQKQGDRAYAAAAMELYIQAGESKSEAARLAAGRLKLLPNFEDLQGKAVAKWREACMTEAPTDNFGADRFKRVINELTLKFPNQPRQGAEFLIAQLKKAAGSKNPEMPPS